MTVIGGMELGRELAKTLAEINVQIEAIRNDAKGLGIPAFKLLDTQGGYVMAPLLAAKAQTLHALVLVNQRTPRSGT